MIFQHLFPTGPAIAAALLATLAVSLTVSTARAQASPPPLQVIATVPDLGDLAREIGGDGVAVTVLARGGDDPHFLEARPSFIRNVAGADVFLQVGMELEAAWAPLVLRQAGNARAQPHGRGHIDASTAITPRGVPEGPVDRSRGDVHVQGNPHYLLDPLAGLAVAELLRDRFSALRPERAERFQQRYDDFRRRMGEAMIGRTLAAEYDFVQLARLHEHGRLRDLLAEHDQLDILGGWLGQVIDHHGVRAVGDHNLWPYFAGRFGVEVVGFLEPLPGMPPTTRHLRQLVRQMGDQQVGLILSAPYFDARHARFVAQHTNARVVPLAHQVGARPGTETYLDKVDHNVRQLVEAINANQATQ